MIWAAGLISMLAALAATRLAIAFSLRRGVLDVPNPRSSHSQPVPRLGGIGILVAVAVTLGFLSAMGSLADESHPILTRAMVVMVGAGSMMSAIGLWDDLFGMRPTFKLLWQLAVAAAVVALGYRVESVQVAGWSPILLGLVSIPATILWLAGFTNIVNFMDGINGISAVTAAVYFLFFSVFSWLEGSIALVFFAVIFAGACIGFLPHNFPRARTFMGDTGSLMLGIVLSFQVVCLIQQSPEMLIPMLLVCSLYLWDSGFTILCRLKRRENIFEAHRTHLYQRLVKAGHSHARITVLYFLLHLVMGSLALAWYGSQGMVRAGVITIAILVLGAFTARVYQVEGRRRGEKVSRNQETAA